MPLNRKTVFVSALGSTGCQQPREGGKKEEEENEMHLGYFCIQESIPIFFKKIIKPEKQKQPV